MGSRLTRANGLAVGSGREFTQNFAPPGSVFFAMHGQFQRRLAPRPAPDRGAGEQTPAQGVEFHFLQLPLGYALPRRDVTEAEIMAQLKQRHRQRQASIDSAYRRQRLRQQPPSV